MEVKEFEELIGREFDFFGVDMNEFKLDQNVWEALEDEGDGYRSYLDSVVVKESTGIFFDKPLAKVKVEKLDDGYKNVFMLIDLSDNHVWLTFGTENYDDYYPYFVFEYKPKEQ